VGKFSPSLSPFLFFRENQSWTLFSSVPSPPGISLPLPRNLPVALGDSSYLRPPPIIYRSVTSSPPSLCYRPRAKDVSLMASSSRPSRRVYPQVFYLSSSISRLSMLVSMPLNHLSLRYSVVVISCGFCCSFFSSIRFRPPCFFSSTNWRLPYSFPLLSFSITLPLIFSHLVWTCFDPVSMFPYLFFSLVSFLLMQLFVSVFLRSRWNPLR